MGVRTRGEGRVLERKRVRNFSLGENVFVENWSGVCMTVIFEDFFLALQHIF